MTDIPYRAEEPKVTLPPLQNSPEDGAPLIPGLDAAPAERADRLQRVPWGAVALFTVVSFVLAWVVALPLWIMDPEGPAYTTVFGLVAPVMMFTPAVATAAAVFITRAPRTQWMRFLGMWPLRPAKRIVWFTVASLFAPLLIVVIGLLVAVLFGWITLDLEHFSGMRAVIDSQLEGLDPATASIAAEAMPSLGLLVAIQIVAIPFGALINAGLAFGEEVGWRGWLLTALRPLGTWPALLITGALWGLWHSPLILIGYNFGLTDWRGVALMTVGCMFWGILFGWARLRTGSVWPAVFGHGALNASAGLFMVLAAADSPLDPALVLPLGLSGWVAVTLVTVVLVLTGQFKRQPALAPAKEGSAVTG